MDCSTLGFPVHHQLPELVQTHVHTVGDLSNHLIFCCPLLLLPSILPSIISKPINPLGPQAGLLHDRLRPLRSSEDKQLAQGQPASDTQAYPLQPLSLKPPPNSPPLPWPSTQKRQILL